jgi:recombination protein RecA
VYDRAYHLAQFKKMGLDSVSWITTGIPDFDALTQIPRGRVTQIQGPLSAGKTTLCLNMIKGLSDKKILYIDSEAALNPELLVNMGLNSDNFTLYNDSAFIEDIYEVIMAAVEHAKFDMIVFDSLAACTFRTEASGNAADANMGQKAKIANKLMRLIPMELKRTNTALVIINQERELLNSMYPVKYTPGGTGVPYTASLIIQLRTSKGARFPKSGPPFKGQEITAEIIKSKVNDPWRKATFKLYYGGFDDRTTKA